MSAQTTLHVLPGDSLAVPFAQTGIAGDMVVCRECLVDGAVQGDTLEDFWAAREAYLSEHYTKPAGFYRDEVKRPLDSLQAVSTGSQVNLWFEHELFCQVNLWFCLYLLHDSAATLYRVMPQVTVEADRWHGFGTHGIGELKHCFAERQLLGDDDIQLGASLWQAYQCGEHTRLAALGRHQSACFPYLDEVVRAALEEDVRPKATLRRLINAGNTAFPDAFRAFCKNEPVYGYGDLQVKRLFDAIAGARP